MNNIDQMHLTAMNLYDLGRVAKAKGDTAIYDSYLRTAFFLEKEVAIKSQADSKDDFWKYVYACSAAHLAIKCERYQEAKLLAEMGLAATPPPSEKIQLEDVLHLAKEKLVATTLEPSHQSTLFGIVLAVDLSKKELVIQQLGTNEIYQLTVVQENIENIARVFIGRAVRFETHNNAEQLFLKQIKFAA